MVSQRGRFAGGGIRDDSRVVVSVIGGVSARVAGRVSRCHAETPSITRLEGSRWRGGRLWSWNRDLRAWAVADGRAVGARAAAARTRDVARDGTTAEATGSPQGSKHTAPDT